RAEQPAASSSPAPPSACHRPSPSGSRRTLGGTPGRYDRAVRMRGSRGGLALLSVALMVAALPPPAAGEAGGGPVAAPSALLLVERLTLDEALAATRGR